MAPRAIETLSLEIVMEMVKTTLAEQRAWVFVFFTDSHGKLSARIDQFRRAMSQAAHCFAGYSQSGSTFVNQKDCLGFRAQFTKASKSIIALPPPV